MLSSAKLEYSGVLYLSHGVTTRFLIFRKAFHALGDNPKLIILGDDRACRLPIFSLVIYHEDSGKIVHHNFISVLLNDLYGIQARGGCACAGPYAQVSNNSFVPISMNTFLFGIRVSF